MIFMSFKANLRLPITYQ